VQACRVRRCEVIRLRVHFVPVHARWGDGGAVHNSHSPPESAWGSALANPKPRFVRGL